jgi:ankyrin repeat protein
MTQLGEDDWYVREQLHFAAQGGDLDRVNSLLAAGYNINAFDQLGKTPLHYAAEKGDLDMVRLLISHGSDVDANHEPTIGNTPLGDVAATCSFDMAKLLVDSGASPTVPGWMQITPIYRASKRTDDEGRKVYDQLAGRSS